MCRAQIVKVKCPYCGKEMYKHDSSTQVSADNWIHDITWRCSGKCVYIFSEEWFNNPKFQQFESCVTRASKEPSVCLGIKRPPKDLNTSDAY